MAWKESLTAFNASRAVVIRSLYHRKLHHSKVLEGRKLENFKQIL